MIAEDCLYTLDGLLVIIVYEKVGLVRRMT